MPVDPKEKLRKLSEKAPKVSDKVKEKIKRQAEIMQTTQDYKNRRQGG